MLKERYYYSEPLKFGVADVILDEHKDLYDITKVKFTNKNYPRFTVCGLYDTEEDVIYFGVAKCSKEDTFVKSIGRKIAKDRALSSSVLVANVEGGRISDTFIEGAEKIIEWGFLNKIKF